ncbi:tRNA(Ile)-lysidine synthetase [Vibrio navarrensis]|uniref:tRNA lysidine(34) synthetase TilS n=1 Tax=Vibrio navarrensis TaxID=29495 RepID=UPI00052C76F6|nr:tRNA lysidine(34) synthetase TilS [Vibrio navarrensis]EHA1125184.1 tRNA lysidine(34) synthetase TilS [Vibrio navarrensis]KGK22508.1 tRNA(Ile)-lysidine synthetase [Vibrio navarrensis]
MESIYHRFTKVISDHLLPASRLVVAFSGGVDSRILLECAARFAFEQQRQCVVVHVHHGLSDNADLWSQRCVEWCQEKQLSCVVEKVQLELMAGDSVEERARQARYQALAKHLEPGDLLLTGQHADDQVETFLLALKRGSGPKGLSAMAQCAPFAQGFLLRPLLSVARSEIELAARQLSLEWVEDESNLDTRYDRNFLRQEVLPKITQRWPGFAGAVQRSAQLCAEQESLLDELLSPVLARALQADHSLALAVLCQQGEQARLRLLRMWLSALGQPMPSRQNLQILWQQVALAKVDANPILQLGQGQVRRFNQRLYFVAQSRDISQWRAEIKLSQSLPLPDHLGVLTLEHTPGQGHLALPPAGEKLYVTFEPEGLSAHPAERGHRRKMKKLFQEYQVPSWLRRRTPILMCADKVVAVAGLFVDREFIGQDCELFWRK